MCCCHGYISLDNFVPSDLYFDKLHILLAFNIYHGGGGGSFCHGGVERLMLIVSPDLLYLGWKGYDSDYC